MKYMLISVVFFGGCSFIDLGDKPASLSVKSEELTVENNDAGLTIILERPKCLVASQEREQITIKQAGSGSTGIFSGVIKLVIGAGNFIFSLL